MESGINFTSNLGSNPGIELDTPRFKVYSFAGRVTSGGGKFEADNCMYNTIKNSLFNSASLVITPNSIQEGKLYSVIPSDGSGDMSVTRATTATRVNSAGLVELVPYNLIPYSQEFSNSSFWNYYVSNVTANTAVAPDGTTTADTIAITGTNGSTYQSTTVAEGTYTISAYFKKTNEDNVYMDCAIGGGNYFGASFNLTTLATTTFGGGFFPLIESVGNGWFRCSVQGYANGSGGYGFGVYAGSGQSAYIWGAQLNEGTIKPYQKTETRLNIPRLDYSNGTCPSLLVEPQRTNLLQYSSSFDNAIWEYNQVTTTANTSTAPDGTVTADRLQGTGSSWYFAQPKSLSAGVSHTISMYVKSNTGSNQTFRLFGCNSLVSSNFTATTEWQRFEFTFTSTTDLLHGIARNSSDNTADLLVWGAQLEAGSYATSYIPTTSASVTRNADVISKTGISSLIGQTEGTIFLDVESFFQDSTFLLQIDDATSDNRFILTTTSGTQAEYYVITGGAVQANASGGTLPNKGHIKLALAYKNNDFAFYANGQQINLDASGSVPATSILRLGENSVGAGNKGAEYNSVALWKTRLTNDELASLTTI